LRGPDRRRRAGARQSGASTQSKELGLSGPDDLAGSGLRYVSDEQPGIRRQRRGRGWRYTTPEGRPVQASERQRLEHLAIPPAWSDVWICTDPRGHLQATGRDAKKRKQYIYHERFRQLRDQDKFDHVVAFGEALPRIRAAVDRDLGKEGLPREKVVAAVVRLLDRTHIRVGNEEYVRQNGSYGLTTLRSRHVELDASRIRFQFRGKSGVERGVELADRRVARVIRECLELPGQQLFQYLDESGIRNTVSSDDVNTYLAEVVPGHFTSKDFRTWAGTVLATLELTDDPELPANKSSVTAAVKAVAKLLGNTPAVCRRCYIHPGVLSAHLDGSLAKLLQPRDRSAEQRRARDLSEVEAAILRLLRVGRATTAAA